MTIESGRKMINDWTSTRDAPPVENNSSKNSARIQNCPEGLLIGCRILGKIDLV